MVLTEAVAASAASAHGLFNYNRSNYLFDRKMRQEQEFKVLEFRKAQAELWREDIRDIIGLTEKKMDTYLIISVLQVEMCVGLFCEGRLEPGTPVWLLHFYMLTLSAAFMYLLMSTWLAMHAAIVAQCTSVRLLTQFVRLPVPTFEQLEDLRTYGVSYEDRRIGDMLRVPFTTDTKPYAPGRNDGTKPSPKDLAVANSTTSLTSEDFAHPRSSSSKGGHTDPWRLEPDGDTRGIYELQHHPAALRRHVMLARRAASQYQCYDGFARVSMTFGTNQLLRAVACYCLGYVGVQDGAPWPALSVVMVMVGMAMMLSHLDFSLTLKESITSQLLIFVSFMSTAICTVFWVNGEEEWHSLIQIVLPIGYFSHGAWLLWALLSCGMVRTSNGAVLPMKFRAILYLDVFGWNSEDPSCYGLPQRTPRGFVAKGESKSFNRSTSCKSALSNLESLHELGEQLRADVALWQNTKVQAMMDDRDRDYVHMLVDTVEEARVALGLRPCQGPAPDDPISLMNGSTDDQPCLGELPRDEPPSAVGQCVQLRGFSDVGTEVRYTYDPDKDDVVMDAARGDALEEGFLDHGSNDYRLVRTIASFHERVDRYCMKASAHRIHGRGDLKRPDPPKRTAGCGAFGESSVLDALKCGTIGMEEEHEFVYRPLPKAEDLCFDSSDVESEQHGPSGEIHHAPTHVFAASSYAPKHPDAEDDDSNIVTGHDRERPGQLPAKMFRLATLMLVTLWAAGMLVAYGFIGGLISKPLRASVFVEEVDSNGEETTQQVNAMVGVDPFGLPELIPGPKKGETELPTLGPGTRIDVGWPSHSAFVPRAIACDLMGNRFLVSDDFGLYGGRLKSQPNASHTFSLDFRQFPLCAALEGEELEDVDMACAEGEDYPCLVFALHTGGTRLSACTLKGMRQDGSTLTASKVSLEKPTDPWTIPQQWLHKVGHKRGETVTSIAVSGDCFRDKESGLFELLGQSAKVFQPDEQGCVDVGTSAGRIVQLGASRADDRSLVPRRIMHQRTHASVRGSLVVACNGYLLSLWHGTSSVSAYDSREGTTVGEWTLPKDVQWLMLTGGANGLFALGVENQRNVVLRRFEVPAELRAPKAEEVAEEHSEI